MKQKQEVAKTHGFMHDVSASSVTTWSVVKRHVVRNELQAKTRVSKKWRKMTPSRTRLARQRGT